MTARIEHLVFELPPNKPRTGAVLSIPRFASHRSKESLRMNGDPMTTLVAAIEGLFQLDDRWRPVPSPGGAMLTRGWPDESVDTVLIVSPDTTYAWREDPQGRESQHIRGTAEQVLATVGRWPDPGVLDGSDHVPGPSGRWT